MILVASTLASYKCGDVVIGYGPEETLWLGWAEQLVENARSVDHDVSFMVALEVDGRGLAPFAFLLDRLAQITSDTGTPTAAWKFSLDTRAESLGSGERLAHICTGRNLITEHAVRSGADWVLFADSDTVIPAEAPSKLLELDWPIVGGEVHAYYGPNGIGPWGEAPDVQRHPRTGKAYDFPVKQHWNTAGFLMVERRLFRQLRWRSDPDIGLTDDPCYAQDALAQGYPTLVRQDLIGVHAPLEPVEQRGRDLRIYR